MPKMLVGEMLSASQEKKKQTRSNDREVSGT